MNGSGWRTGSGASAIGPAIATAVLGGAAAVLAASALGVLHPRLADAATGPTGATGTTVGVTGTTGVTGATGATGSTAPAVKHHPKPTPNAKPTRHGPLTLITHLPVDSVADGTRGVAVRLNGDPAPNTPRPTITPHVAGSWVNFGPYEMFRPVSTLEPCTTYRMRIPATTFAIKHRRLRTSRSTTFGVSCPGVTAVQEALARLGYLPYTLHGFVGASSTSKLTRRQAAKRAFVLPHGVLKANVRGAPPLSMGTLDPATTGAMEVFEGNHGMAIGTTITKQLWVELIAGETLAHKDPNPYTWVTVTKTLPETLEVHEGRKVALSSPTNTGVPGADTASGIFPIYVRYVATTMIGTNVDGSHYDDPGVPWVNYFNGGDAVHGYIRPGYGYPQSNGCVELPIATAQKVYGMLQVGDLVIVS